MTMSQERPKDRHGDEIHIGYRVRFGNGLEGRVRAWGWTSDMDATLAVVVLHGSLPRGHDVLAKDTTITERGF
jgi:hypothetical protein